MNEGKQVWLAPFSWAVVTAQNKVLCDAKNAYHGPTSDGHEQTKHLWEQCFQAPLTLHEAVDLCRKCHRMAPFCFYNGNTFAAVARAVISELNLDQAQAFVVRSLVGHIVAGVATEEETASFKEFCDQM